MLEISNMQDVVVVGLKDVDGTIQAAADASCTGDI